jgi:TRAP transporter TAXI family solute receptor
MRSTKTLRVAGTFMVAALLAAACGDDGGGGGNAGAGGSDGGRETTFVSIATGGTGGTYYPYGGALASVLSSEVDGVNASAEATGASVENVRLIQNGDAQVALIQADAAFQAVNGTGDFSEKQDVQAIAYMYPNYMQMTTLEGKGIENISDFKGKRIAVGDAGSAAELGMRIVTGALGISYDDFAQTQRIGFTEMTTAFRNGQIDVGNYVGSLGLGAVQDLASTEKIKVLGLTDEQMEKVAAEAPFITPGTVPAGTYKGVTEDVQNVPSLSNFVVVKADMDEDLVYDITKALYENRDRLEAAHPVAKDTLPENMVDNNKFLPIHPGALRYFEEQGIEIPEELKG